MLDDKSACPTEIVWLRNLRHTLEKHGTGRLRPLAWGLGKPQVVRCRGWIIDEVFGEGRRGSWSKVTVIL